MKTLLVAVASIILSVAAQFVLKAGVRSAVASGGQSDQGPLAATVRMLMEPMVLGGFALYGLGAVVWLYVLSNWDVTKAYPLVGLGFVLTLAVGTVLGETVGPLRVLGVLLIVSGVWFVARS